jgi:hypothetical protein
MFWKAGFGESLSFRRWDRRLETRWRLEKSLKPESDIWVYIERSIGAPLCPCRTPTSLLSGCPVSVFVLSLVRFICHVIVSLKLLAP